MATVRQLQGGYFDPERFERAVQKARRDVAKRRGLPPPPDDEILPELPPVEDGAVKPRHRD